MSDHRATENHRPSQRHSPRLSFLLSTPVIYKRPYAFPFFTDRAHRHGSLTSVPCATLRPANLSANLSAQSSQYVPLHVHSDFSLLDGASQLSSLVARAEELSVPALALTDHGVLYGAIQLVRMCRNTSVKPIIGNEMYIINHPLPLDTSSEHLQTPTPKRYHVIVLAKNATGYRNLVKLTTMAHLSGRVGKGIFSRPCINKAQLFQHREGLIVSSACLGGEIPQAILNDDVDAARSVASWYRDVFGDDFYLEIQDHGSAEDKKVNPVLLEISRQLGIKVIATNDSHFTSCLDSEAHDAMICIQTGKLLSDEKRLRYAGNEYFKSFDEMRQCFVDHLPIDAIDEALYNTLNAAEKVGTYELFGATRIPDFPTPQNFVHSLDEYLRHVAREGLQSRLRIRSSSGLFTDTEMNRYETRLEEELGMIIRMGFSSYFLVVWDYIRHARDIKIPVGPGRGSAAGSLVAFALRITDIDPIKFNLLFERFLNPERRSMPDIDTDFSVEGREKVIQYVTNRYGGDRVAQIITFNRLTSKAVIKDVARVHNVPYAEADRLAKLVPVVRGKPATLSQLMSEKTPSKEFKSMVEKNPSYKLWLDKAQRIEGANKTFGIHAAGVVISATPLTDIVPLSKAKHGETITQYAMEDVEALGLLKMDFLGLKNLSVIETALNFINEGRRQRGILEDLDFSVDSLPLDDSNTYKLLAEGELDGIFQLDASAGMRKVVRELRPSCLDDISSVLALYRPGPLDAGLIPKFIRRKHGTERIEYEHPLLEPILKDTYGIMVYQEQIMRIARDLAGYSLGQADILRRAMGKKKLKDMEQEMPKFVKGAMQRGIPSEVATNLFEQMLKFADYCFNKSHSTAYAFLTYQTAYLKANYPVEYCAALLHSNMNQSDKLVRYLADANTLGVHVMPPSINRSSLGFTVDRGVMNSPVVLFGLEAVKSLGTSVGTALIEERERHGPFHDIIDLIDRVDLRLLNKRSMGSLIQAGAFDELHPNRKVLLEKLDSLLTNRRKLRDKRRRREVKGMTTEEEECLSEEEQLSWEAEKVLLAAACIEESDFSQLERLAGEKATMGFYASGHPLYELQEVAKLLDCTPISQIVGETDYESNEEERITANHHGNVEDGSSVVLLSCITDLKRMTTAKGKKMARWVLEDLTGRVSAIIFPGSNEILEQRVSSLDASDGAESAIIDPTEAGHVIEEDARVVVWGTVDRKASGIAQIIVDDVQRVEEVKVLLASTRESRRISPNDCVDVLYATAANILGPDAAIDSPNTYIDSNGEVRKTRRKRSKPLSLKNRVPLVLQHSNEDGNVNYVNLGSNVRFPASSSNDILALEGKLGFNLRMISVGKDVIGNSSRSREEPVQVDSDFSAVLDITEPGGSSENELHQRSIDLEKDNVLDEATSNEFSLADAELEEFKQECDRTLQTIMAREERSEIKSLFSLDESEVGSEDISNTGNENNVDHRQQEINDSVADMKDLEAVEMMMTEDEFERSAGHQSLIYIRDYIRLRSSDTFMQRNFSRSLTLREFRSHDIYKDEGVKVLPTETRTVATIETHTDKTTSSYGATKKDATTIRTYRTNATSFDSSLQQFPRENVDSRNAGFDLHKGEVKSDTSPRTLSDRHGWSNGATADVSFVQDDHKSEDTAPAKSGLNVEVELNNSSSVNATPQERKEGHEGKELISKRGRPRKEITIPGGALNGNELDETSELHQSGSEIKSNVISDMSPSSSMGRALNGSHLKNSTPTQATNTAQSSKSKPPSSTISSGFTTKPCEDSGAENISNCQNETALRERVRTYALTEQVANQSLPSCRTRSDVAANGIIVDFDNADLAGVLDAVGVVSSAVVANDFEDGHTIACMSGISLDNLVEDGVSLQVTGRVAYADGNMVFVLVDVREVVPSGKRKRVRSFGPIAVVLQTEKEVATSALKTKKAKKCLSSFIQKIGNCRDFKDIGTESNGQPNGKPDAKLTASNSSKSIVVQSSEVGLSLLQDFSQSKEETTETTCFLDGGEIVAYMTRAAEVCANKALKNAGAVSVGTLEWVVAPSPAVWRDLRSVCIRTHLEGLSFGTMKMQVEAEVLTSSSAKSHKLVGAFVVRSENSQFLKQLRVRNDDVPLFDRSEALSKISEVELKLKSIVG